MNAQAVWEPDETLGERLVAALVRVRLSTRVLLLAAAAMLGALAYMTVNWPALQAPVTVTVSVVAPRPAAPVLQAVLLPRAESPETTLAGSLVVDAARAVSAAASSPVSARVSHPPAEAAPVAAAAPATRSGPAIARTVIRTGSQAFAPQNADSAVESAFAPVQPGVNRIAVPTPAAASGSGAVPNHVGVPPTQPPSGP